MNMYPRTFKGWFQRLLVIISQTFNALILLGDPDETVSARAYRTPWPRVAATLDALWFWEEDHCRASFGRDLQRASRLLGVYDN